MKLTIFKTLSFLVLSTGLMFFSSCEENSIVEVSASFQPLIGTENLALNETVTISSVATSFTQIYFYAHDMTLKRSSNEDQTFDKYLLVGANSTHTLGDVEKGTITGINFNIGVDAVANSQTEAAFTSRTADDPLAQQSPSMHWNWNTGYKFVRIEGLVDKDGDGTPEEPFARHIGSDAMLRAISVSTNKELTGESQDIRIGFDLAKILEDADLIGTPNVHGMDEAIMTNFQTAFTIL